MMTASLVLGSFLPLILGVSVAIAGKLPDALRPEVMQSTRIVGGVAAKRGEFVGQVSLQNQFRSHVCGGTLIDPTHIITAAHCHQTSNIIVYAMGDDIVVSKNGSNTRQIRIIESFVKHPDFDVESMDNDIAIIRIDAPFKTSANFSAMPRSTQTPDDGRICTAVGWGTTIFVPPPDFAMASLQLLKVNVEVFNRTYCNSEDSYNGAITSSMFCAGDKNGDHDACQGDSGGLLTCDGHSLTGIVSFGWECGLPEYPGVYTDVSKFNTWIDDTIAIKELPAYEYAIESTTTSTTTTETPTATDDPGAASIPVASLTILILFEILGLLLARSNYIR